MLANLFSFIFVFNKFIYNEEMSVSKQACHPCYVISDRDCIKRSKGFILKEGRFRLGIRKKFLSVRVVMLWNRFPREEVDVFICTREHP